MIKTLTHLLTPHHTNNHRPRLLHPAGFAVMIAFALFFHSGLELVKIRPPQGLVLGYSSSITATQVIDLTNAQRVQSGLPPLTHNSQLSQAAAAKARDMFQDDYWAHISPTGTTPWQFIRSTGYKYTVAGENLARDFELTDTMVGAWMDSPTHKANIVHPKYTETGVAVVNGTLEGIETTLVVQMFGLPVQPATELATESTASPQISDTAGISQPGEPITLTDTTPSVLSESETALTANPGTTYVSPMEVKKSVLYAIIGLIIGVLVVDELVIRYKKTIRFVGRNLAHLGFLTVVILIIATLAQPGGIL